MGVRAGRAARREAQSENQANVVVVIGRDGWWGIIIWIIGSGDCEKSG